MAETNGRFYRYRSGNLMLLEQGWFQFVFITYYLLSLQETF